MRRPRKRSGGDGARGAGKRLAGGFALVEVLLACALLALLLVPALATFRVQLAAVGRMSDRQRLAWRVEALLDGGEAALRAGAAPAAGSGFDAGGLRIDAPAPEALAVGDGFTLWHLRAQARDAGSGLGHAAERWVLLAAAGRGEEGVAR